MNKEELLECFFKERSLNTKVLNCCELYPTYLTSEMLEPAAFEQAKENSSKQLDRLSDRRSANFSESRSMTENYSMYSAFSRISVDQTFYNDIITNRKKHNLFLELEEEDVNLKKWYYLDETQTIHGPFSSTQMNDFFIFNKLTVNFKVKEAYKNDDFISIKYVIKRYYKKFVAKMEEANVRKPELKNSTKNFKKGALVMGKGRARERLHTQGRTERGFSDATLPHTNYFLDELVEDKDIMDVVTQRKERAATNS